MAKYQLLQANVCRGSSDRNALDGRNVSRAGNHIIVAANLKHAHNFLADTTIIICHAPSALIDTVLE